MNDVAARGSTAAALLWLGMVLAISFLEAPLKFRTPGLDLRTGLAMGRIVFRALNAAEIVWAAVVAAALIAHPPPSTAGTVAAVTALVVLAVQLCGVRPRLARHSERVLAGADEPRSGAHHVYIGLEFVKVFALAALGVALLSG
jgi:hypothetical protein